MYALQYQPFCQAQADLFAPGRGQIGYPALQGALAPANRKGRRFSLVKFEGSAAKFYLNNQGVQVFNLKTWYV